MKRSSEASLPNTPRSNTPNTPGPADNYEHYVSRQDSPAEDYQTPNANPRPNNSASRTNSSQMSSSALLMNIAALQTTTNNKLDKLADAIYGLHNSIEKMHREQVKQGELLVSIVRNTANIKINVNEGQNQNQVKGSKVKAGNIKEYGFSTTKQLFAEFLIKLLEQIKIQITAKGKKYTSMRDMNLKLTSQIITYCMDNQFKINGTIEQKIDANSQSHPSLVKVASSIGSVDGTNPILSPEAFREIFDDVEANFFVSCFQNILERMRIIKLLIPFYEADIISCIEYPFFNKDGDVICNWHKLIPRNEDPNETTAANAKIPERKKLAEFLAKGMSTRAAFGAALNN